jgi:predicted flap endonuclease-1-like 5' DNA nuclease
VIWHFFEIWGLLIVAFAAGCGLGTLLYMALAASPLAGAQVAAADSVIGILDELRLPGRARREASAYRAPPREEPYMPMAPLMLAPEPASPVEAPEPDIPPEPAAFDTGEEEAEEPVDISEAEWDDEPYWDDAEDDYPAVEDAAPPSDGRVETTYVPEFVAEAPPPAPPEARPAPEPEPELEPEEDLPAMRPLTLPGPRNGVPDNLQRIRGIGQKNEELLNSLGVYHFGQIAAWTPAEARWIASHLAFPERIERDDWVGQAIVLATGGDTGHVKAAERRRSGREPPVAA